MAWGFRESFRFGPFRFNINKKSVSTMVGTRRVHYTVNSNGQRTESVRLGNGFSLRRTRRKRR